MRVIADPMLHPRRQLAVDIAVRTVLIAAVAVLIFGILPVIAQAAA